MELLGMMLNYYCEPQKQPFFSITRLPKEEAFKKAAQLAKGNGAVKNKFSATDFPGYYEARMRAEQWLYDELTKKGISPKERHPIYFVLGESEFLHQWFGNGRIYTVPVRDIMDHDLSFTIGDSMNIVDRPERQVYSQGEITKILDRFESMEELFHDMPYRCRYIEVQVWADLQQLITKES